MKTIDIFLKTFHRDFWLLKISLDSIRRNVNGYQNLILVLPSTDQNRFEEEFNKKDYILPDNTKTCFVDYPGPNGYIWQQWFKIRAFEYSDSDYIMYTDADCIFDIKIDIGSLIINDKPEIIYRDWETCEGWFWRKATEDFMKEKVPYEFMARQNMVVHRSTLVNIATRRPELKEELLQYKPYKFSKSEDRFSEYNAIGAFCYRYERNQYNFVAESDLTWKKSILIDQSSDDPGYNIDTYSLQAWSHASKKGDAFSLKEYIRLLEAILKSHNIPIPHNPNTYKNRTFLIKSAVKIKRTLTKVKEISNVMNHLFSGEARSGREKPRRRKREDHELGW